MFKEPVILDDARILQLGGNVADGRALFDGDGLLGTQVSAAVDLAVELHAFIGTKAHQSQDDDNDQAAHGEMAAMFLFFLVVIFLIFWLGFRLAAGLGGRGRSRLGLGLRRGGVLRGLPAGTADFHKLSLFCFVILL